MFEKQLNLYPVKQGWEIHFEEKKSSLPFPSLVLYTRFKY